jgi:sterol desaturase/sphingolipid hydroxylase (fatty acid hydroxylase superfamily)
MEERRRPQRRQPSDRGLGLAVLAGAVLLAVAERRRPLRRPVESGARRIARNLALAATSAAVVHVLERPITGPLARAVERKRVGLAFFVQRRTGISDAMRDALAVVGLDWTLYLWHVLVHRVPALYRFHAVHHADPDLDLSTALRFHGGEFALSIPWRAAQIVVLGVSPRALGTWRALSTLSVLFHHSNVRLDARVERVLGWLVTTPRLHGIHHSQIREEQQSNWSSGLSAWDRLHGTHREDVQQASLRFGALPTARAEYDDAPASRRGSAVTA